MRLVLILALLFVIAPKKDLYAATISHHAQSMSVGIGDEVELDVDLNIQSSDGTEYFLRGVFYRPGDNNYCGFTWNGSAWFSGPYTTSEQWKNFQKISVAASSWTGKVKIKIDPDDSGCRESGEYKVKVQRFTSLGAGTFDDQNETTLTVTVPTHTPTASPTQAPTATPKPTKVPTQAPTPKATPQATQPKSDPIVIKNSLSDEENIALTSKTLQGKNIFGASTQGTPTTKGKKDIAPSRAGKSSKKEEIPERSGSTKKNKGNTFVYLGGGSLLTGCGILLYQTYRKKIDE